LRFALCGNSRPRPPCVNFFSFPSRGRTKPPIFPSIPNSVSVYPFPEGDTFSFFFSSDALWTPPPHHLQVPPTYLSCFSPPNSPLFKPSPPSCPIPTVPPPPIRNKLPYAQNDFSPIIFFPPLTDNHKTLMIPLCSTF